MRVEQKENGRRVYSWAAPGTGTLSNLIYGLPDGMAMDLGSQYLLTKVKMMLMDKQADAMQGKNQSDELEKSIKGFIEEEKNGGMG